jgi:hypothetical protein
VLNNLPGLATASAASTYGFLEPGDVDYFLVALPARAGSDYGSFGILLVEEFFADCPSSYKFAFELLGPPTVEMIVGTYPCEVIFCFSYS